MWDAAPQKYEPTTGLLTAEVPSPYHGPAIVYSGVGCDTAGVTGSSAFVSTWDQSSSLP